MDDELITLLTSKELGLSPKVIEDMRAWGMDNPNSIRLKRTMLLKLENNLEEQTERLPFYQQAIEGLKKCLEPKEGAK